MNMNAANKPKNTRKLIIIIVTVYIVVQCVGIIGLILFQNWLEGERMKTRCEEITLYLTTYDKEFEEQYGKVVSVELDPDQKWKSLKDNEFLIPCIVTVEGGDRYSMTVDYDRDFGSLTIEYDQVELIGS